MVLNSRIRRKDDGESFVLWPVECLVTEQERKKVLTINNLYAILNTRVGATHSLAGIAGLLALSLSISAI